MIPSTEITGIVLAGGQGRRMGGVDKGWVELEGRPMIAHVLDRFAPQVADVLINANQNLDRYAGFGLPVVPDAVGGFAGPLAGLHAGMTRATRRTSLPSPAILHFCRSIWWRGLRTGSKPVARSSPSRSFRPAASCLCLVRRDVLPHLAAFLETGGRKIDAWYATLSIVEVAFDDESDAFRNINTTDELAAAARS